MTLLPPETRTALTRLASTGRPVVALHEFPVLFMLQCALAFAPDRPTTPIVSQDSVETITRAVYLAVDLLHDSLERHLAANTGGTAAAMFERSHIQKPFRSLLRSYGLWLWHHGLHDNTSTQARAWFDALLTSTVGLSLTDLLFGCAAWALPSVVIPPIDLPSTPLAVAPPFTGFAKQDHTALELVLELLSTSPENLRDDCKALGSLTTCIATPSLLPLKRTPILKHSDGRYQVLSASWVADAATQRPLRLAERDAGTRGTGRTEFGHVFEAYAHGILGSVFGQNYQRISSTAAKRGRQRPYSDGVIWFPHGFIVVEVKSQLSPEALRYRMRTSASYIKELEESGVRTALTQIWETTMAIAGGSIPNRCTQNRVLTASMIVMWQEVPQSSVVGDVIAPFCQRPKEHSWGLQLSPQFVGIDSLEDLSRFRCDSLLSKLADKMASDSTRYSNLINYLQLSEQPQHDGTLFATLGDGLRNVIARHSVPDTTT